MAEEIWKDIVGYEGYYQVSNIGNVKSLDRFLPDGRRRKGIILKPYIDKDGYAKVTLTMNSKSRHFMIHRLVATAFIENKSSMSQINHKDEIKTNNNVNNLEWCDAKYNLSYGNRTSKAVEKIRGENNYQSKVTEKDVVEIREKYIPNDKQFGQCALARKYGMRQTSIRSIIIGKNWKCVKGGLKNDTR